MNRYELIDCEDNTKVYGYITTELTTKQVQDIINPTKDMIDLEELKELLYKTGIDFEEISEDITGSVYF